MVGVGMRALEPKSFCTTHLHRTAFPGTARYTVPVSFREGRCGAVQVSKACAFDENHIRLGLVLRNEYPAWYFYREK